MTKPRVGIENHTNPITERACHDARKECRASRLRWVLFILGMAFTLAISVVTWAMYKTDTDAIQNTKIDNIEKTLGEIKADTSDIRKILMNGR